MLFVSISLYVWKLWLVPEKYINNLIVEELDEIIDVNKYDEFRFSIKDKHIDLCDFELFKFNLQDLMKNSDDENFITLYINNNYVIGGELKERIEKTEIVEIIETLKKIFKYPLNMEIEVYGVYLDDGYAYSDRYSIKIVNDEMFDEYYTLHRRFGMDSF